MQPGFDTATARIVQAADFDCFRVAAQAEISRFASGTRPAGKGDHVKRGDGVEVACGFERIGHQRLGLDQEPAVRMLAILTLEIAVTAHQLDHFADVLERQVHGARAQLLHLVRLSPARCRVPRIAGDNGS